MFRRMNRARSFIVIALVALAALTSSVPVAADSYGGPWPCSTVHAYLGPWAK
jgi:hypothetical protein